jgi:acyl carrier protein
MDTRFRKLFADTLSIPVENVTDDLEFNSIPQWDSVAHMALVAAIDTEYETMLETEDVIDMSTVGRTRKILKKYGVEV